MWIGYIMIAFYMRPWWELLIKHIFKCSLLAYVLTDTHLLPQMAEQGTDSDGEVWRTLQWFSWWNPRTWSLHRMGSGRSINQDKHQLFTLTRTDSHMYYTQVCTVWSGVTHLALVQLFLELLHWVCCHHVSLQIIWSPDKHTHYISPLVCLCAYKGPFM